MTMMQMYWLTRLDGIRDTLSGPLNVLWVIGLIVCIIFVIITRIDTDTFKNKFSLWPTILLLGVLITEGLLYAFLPTSKEMAAIIVVPKIVNSQRVQGMANKALNVPDKVLDLANEWLDKLKPTK